MLSNSPSSLHARQRSHRRQNSTPSAFESANISQLPNANANARRQAAAHRRGMSLDNRRQQTTPNLRRQESTKVRMSTNITGSAHTSQHHALREAQQQRTQARPGPHPLQYVSMASSENEQFLLSPHGTPQNQRFSSSPYDGIPVPFPYSGQWNMMMQRNQESFANNMTDSKNFGLYSHENASPSPTFFNYAEYSTGHVYLPDEATSRRNSRRISDGIMDRVSRFENMNIEDIQRPTTPPSQNANNYCPPTPMETPHDRVAKQDSRLSRFAGDYDESMEETVRPNRKIRAGQSSQNSFAEMRRHAEDRAAVPSPPRTNRIPNVETFRDVNMHESQFVGMNTLRGRCVKMEDQNDALAWNLDAAQRAARHKSPGIPHAENCTGNAFDARPDTQHLTRSDSVCSSAKSSSHHRRTESVASIASAASIADINIEETRTETGVTLEEISQFILTPETTDGKWTCLFDDCGKKFGRKENIKSHVQTHLNDRQYQCPSCLKCFVRQHDLKRHAKIHTGVKPYPCDCGNSFARHDALTRHRQRGMCVGAFDGVVRKPVKRGRPRKNRPDMETRMEKSARTRQKNMSISSVSSMSGCSESSVPNSPDDDLNMVDDGVAFDMGLYRMQDAPSMSTAPMSTAPMPTLTPRDINAHVTPSPSIDSLNSCISPKAIMEHLPPCPASPVKSAGSRHDTPPELSQSSSPAQAQFFDPGLSAQSSENEMTVTASDAGVMDPSALDGTLSMGMDDQDDMLLHFGQDDSFDRVQFSRDPNNLLMPKFDDGFDDAVNMFTTDDDHLFFTGS